MTSLSPPLANAMRSLEGLSLGDAFGQRFFGRRFSRGLLPRGIWTWTDDTHMALSIVEVLAAHGRIDQDALAQAFARRYCEEPRRGYAGGASELLESVAMGVNWRMASRATFPEGSHGNGAAMRVAPLGAFFFDDLERVSSEARRSAVVTYAHIEGVAGAIAVAVAAALATGRPHPSGREFLEQIIPFVPFGLTRQGIRRALAIAPDELQESRKLLGSGYGVSAQDTVPYCLWSASHHLDDFKEALWNTVQGEGEMDTTCAIVGGIVSLSSAEIPADWLKCREPLPPLQNKEGVER